MSAIRQMRPQPSLAFREEQARPKPDRAWKRFRNYWLLANGFMMVNLSTLLGIGGLNSIERFLFLLAGIAYLRTRKVDWINLSLFGGIVGVTWVFGLFTDFPDFSWFRYAQAIISFFAVMSFMCAWPTQRERKLMLWTLTVLPIGMVVLGGVYQLGGIGSVLAHDYTGVTRLQGNSIPAFLAAAGFAGSVAAAFLTTGFDRRCIVLTGINLAITILTATRMPSAAALIAVSVILFTGLRSGVWRLILVVYGVAVLAGFFALFGQQLITRLEDGGTSGRELMWNALLAALDHYSWTGVGFGHHGLLIPERVSHFTGTVAAHNEYLRMAVELGYVGAGLFLALFLAIFGRLLLDPRNGNRLAFFVTVAMYMMDSYSDNTITATSCFMILVAGLCGVALADPIRKKKHDTPVAMTGWAGPHALNGNPRVRAARRVPG
ncbi:O-antigen ligase family protein [Silvimonas iriomotensis]|uniref:O-antigen ligase-related domain-containing protein n=1 Tax=Silvimonas iriomotensis TaxID=449662 RepID=A0ABQ2P8X0_9NEIS|nr:O-antigen ligase family protein [Silvimonas iriomotensis]GGP20969.1 hypothetical protein GCM10010970_17860 [Silvimonas iriomotensis]